MIKFLLRLQRDRGTRAAVVATRGGIKVGRVVIPGAAGLAVFATAIILILKGYRVLAGLSLDMPANMLNLHAMRSLLRLPGGTVQLGLGRTSSPRVWLWRSRRRTRRPLEKRPSSFRTRSWK